MAPTPFEPADDGELYDALIPDTGELDARFEHPRWVRLGAVILVLLAAGILTVSLRGAQDTPAAATPGRTIKGEIALGSGNYDKYSGASAGSPCFGLRGYNDVNAGAQVLLLDGAGVTIATSSLGAGVISYDSSECFFPFALPDVPKADFYRIKINHRDGPTWSIADLEARGWRVALTFR